MPGHSSFPAEPHAAFLLWSGLPSAPLQKWYLKPMAFLFVNKSVQDLRKPGEGASVRDTHPTTPAPIEPQGNMPALGSFFTSLALPGENTKFRSVL